jgi:hypothetical protein
VEIRLRICCWGGLVNDVCSFLSINVMIKFEFKGSKVMLAAQGNIRTRRLDLESEFRSHLRMFPTHPIHTSTQTSPAIPIIIFSAKSLKAPPQKSLRSRRITSKTDSLMLKKCLLRQSSRFYACTRNAL